MRGQSVSSERSFEHLVSRAGCSRLRGPHRFLVLSYHRVNDNGHPFFPGTPTRLFRSQMELLQRRFDVQPLRVLASGGAPKNAIAVTFDDGYRDNYTDAFPILRELGIPATIFLVTEAVDGNRMIWHDRIFDAYHRTAAPIADRRRELAESLARARSANPVEREALITRLLGRLAVEPCDDGWDKLTWDQVREMARTGIYFGAHTLDHSILSHVGAEEARRQVRGSKERIESELDRAVTLFAYPNGSAADFNETTKTILREEGFRSAATTIAGSNDGTTDPLELRRVGMWSDDPNLSFIRLALSRALG